MFIHITDINIDERIREEHGTNAEQAQFKESFKKYGQLQPIKVIKNGDESFTLVAGERRLRAIIKLHEEGCKIPALDPGMIEASYRDPVPLHTKLMMEFAENNERKDFSYVEKAKFIRRFHETMQLDLGDVWTQEMTAASLNLSTASISHYLRVEAAVKADPTIAKAQTLDAAVKRMKVQEKLKVRHDTVKRDDLSIFNRAKSLLEQGDAREWIKTIQSESIDLINFDPPWGEDASFKSAENHEAFDDSTEYSDELMTALFPELFRVLKNDRYCIFWHRIRVTTASAAMAEAYGFNLLFGRTPCIWFKPDKTTDQNRIPEKRLIPAYEAFFLLRKGDPVFHEHYVNDVFAFDRVVRAGVTHPTEKPMPLCAALIKLCSVPGETLLDPTAGSAAFLDSGLEHNRKVRGCELSNFYHAQGTMRLSERLKTYRTADELNAPVVISIPEVVQNEDD